VAERTKKVADNVPGTFYVDRECIDCDLCRETAPENFQRNEDEGYSYVYKQPESDEERSLCKEALESCPVEAIGDDGAEPSDPSKDGEHPEGSGDPSNPEALTGGMG
jgi:ferredoxin